MAVLPDPDLASRPGAAPLLRTQTSAGPDRRRPPIPSRSAELPVCQPRLDPSLEKEIFSCLQFSFTAFPTPIVCGIMFAPACNGRTS